MMRLLAMVMVVTAQVLGGPLSALAACPVGMNACHDDRAAVATSAAACCCQQSTPGAAGDAPACPCCKGDDGAPVRPEHPALPPVGKTLTDLNTSDVPVPTVAPAPAACPFVPRSDDAGARPRANAKRVQAVLCRWRT